MKRILINATHNEEIRVALVDADGKMCNLHVQSASHKQQKSNIYKGRVIRVEHSLNAAFIDYGSNRHGFLPLQEVSYTLFKKPEDNQTEKINVKESIKEGQTFLVQIRKEERGNKGAALSTFISLAGRYLVLMPNNAKVRGISRQVLPKDRSLARQALTQLEVQDGMGVIIRTAGLGKSNEELQWDLNYLQQLWQSISTEAEQHNKPHLIYKDSNIVIRTIRDFMRKDIDEILIDHAEFYQDGHEFMQQIMPHYLKKLKLYEDDIPLFSKYRIEEQIEKVLCRDVKLPSGGVLIIDHTEALTAIDINSAKGTSWNDIEETAFNTNLEAAKEIAKQLCIRDIGGLIVIDFIDMAEAEHKQKVEEAIKQALNNDYARTSVGEISSFGILEMSRQRLRVSLDETFYRPCPYCNGQGNIRDIKSMALVILRSIEEEVNNRSGGKHILLKTSPAINIFLLNEKQKEINSLKERVEGELWLIPDQDLQASQYLLESSNKKINIADYAPKIPHSKYAVYQQLTRGYEEESKSQVAAVQHRFKSTPASAGIKTSIIGLCTRSLSWLSAPFTKDPDATKHRNKKAYYRSQRQRQRNRRR